MTRPDSKAPKECLSAIQTNVLSLCGSSEVTVTSIFPPSFVSLRGVLIQTNVLSAYRSQYITLCQHSSHQMLPTEQFSLSGQTALASATVNDIGPVHRGTGEWAPLITTVAASHPCRLKTLGAEGRRGRRSQAVRCAGSTGRYSSATLGIAASRPLPRLCSWLRSGTMES